ncbi:hypothetical protein CVU82_02300 [Candidatus Falkowbacteria bacterium HGW-Falkowbacteria-1]|jgi:N-acyl-L-homoserine lactone synthetase|uniref:N-acetyltransferase domain-containing protein n=1 Tax=Candidatus Falkowbacteria bacterium HGW-Falkowbacteria-1 TaxID=2013768 RepID=A0A2N2E9Q0_9BACT|nr:MAG: hypothetical protein CVU82_02300 [Candidatus Falkowbacteria bacterium HGW-Falkowbacteria-1]
MRNQGKINKFFGIGSGKSITKRMVEDGFDLVESKRILKFFYLFYFVEPKDLVVKLAKDNDQMFQVYFLREEIYIEENGLNVKRGYNNYDSDSFHFLALENDVPIGVMRLIKIPDKDWNFQGLYNIPVGSYLSFLDLRNFLEISRFGFLKNHRGNRRYLLKLLHVAHLYARVNNYDNFCGIMRIELLNYLQRIGIKFNFIGEKFVCMDTWNMAPFASSVEENILIIEKNLKI